MKIGDRGADVSLVQYILQIIGYNPGKINGIFGEMTKSAVISFQKERNLLVSGEIGPETYSNLLPYIFGFTQHYIKVGDTLESIAEEYDTTLLGIEIANPDILVSGLIPGTKIKVPFKYDVVKTNVLYNYIIMSFDIDGLKARYPFIQVDFIGESVNGNSLYRIRLGKGENKVIYNASHHANEWITTPVLLKWVEEFLKAYVGNTTLRGYNPREIWDQSTIDIIPMVNPDGVDLVIDGVRFQGEKANQLIEWNYGSHDFKDWKANINGVDLSRNYNAAWDEYKKLEAVIGIIGPGPSLYGGDAPESQPEVLAMVEFSKSDIYRLALSYHTQGQVIYWDFMNKQPPDSKSIGEEFAKVSGYSLAQPLKYEAYASYKDWFIQYFNRPGYMIKCGRGKTPLPIDQFGMIYSNNEELLLLASII